jgi:hypothetical protein
MSTTLYRPEPRLRPEATPIDRGMCADQAASQLCEGERLIVRDHYATGVAVLSALTKRLGTPPSDAGFKERQAALARYRDAALRLLAPIEDHKMALEDGRGGGFLAELYPELSSFSLPFVECQSLIGAWDRYEAGTHLAVLGHKVHPFYGTYAPTRVSHLELFATWLSQYTGSKTRAVDVGTGCGVLALMLARAGLAEVVATDCNPNAVESVRRELLRLENPPPIRPIDGDLLGPGDAVADLVVFNPPWVQGSISDLLDRALTFEPGLFERFFDQAMDRLAPEGRIVLLFSNIISLVQPDVPHPLETELARGRLRLVSKIKRKVKPGVDKLGRRRRTRERVEVWELARA